MPGPVEPTDEQRERDLGRVGVWLDAVDAEWLANHCCCGDDTPDVERERCATVRFRMHAALHKAGRKNTE